MDRQMLEDKQMGPETVAMHPWGELGLSEDIAKAAVWLASDEAAWVTGVALPVDGGYMTA
jgi:NAD(P)-dependent dehydrogenase (short-subunit alcohol dehydrogenase family)